MGETRKGPRGSLNGPPADPFVRMGDDPPRALAGRFLERRFGLITLVVSVKDSTWRRSYVHLLRRRLSHCMTEAHLQAAGGIERRLDKVRRATCEVKAPSRE
jgi:hypothetical protein